MNKAVAKYSSKELLFNRLDDIDAGFSLTLLQLIDLSGEKDVTIYKRANIDRRLFSKIRSNPSYQPSKNTVIAFSFALELTLEEATDFLSRAGYALSDFIPFDQKIIEFFEQELYDVFEINCELFDEDFELLGSKTS
jgi:hypothetical protein